MRATPTLTPTPSPNPNPNPSPDPNPNLDPNPNPNPNPNPGLRRRELLLPDGPQPESWPVHPPAAAHRRLEGAPAVRGRRAGEGWGEGWGEGSARARAPPVHRMRGLHAGAHARCTCTVHARCTETCVLYTYSSTRTVHARRTRTVHAWHSHATCAQGAPPRARPQPFRRP